MDYRIAAEILLRALDDIDPSRSSRPATMQNRMVKHPLDDRLSIHEETLDQALTERGLSPHPSVLLVLEGETEMYLMPKVLERILGSPIPPQFIDIANMRSVTRDIDLLVRYVASLRPGQRYPDFTILARPATRIFVAVDAEGPYSNAPQRRRAKDRLVTRLSEALPEDHRTTRIRRDLASLITIATWGSKPWEFANFTDAQLAAAIVAEAHTATISEQTVLRSVRRERRLATPDITRAAGRAGIRGISKVAVARRLETTLIDRVDRAVASARVRLPAARIAIQVLQLALRTPRTGEAISSPFSV
jgi:hypothetical protein